MEKNTDTLNFGIYILMVILNDKLYKDGITSLAVREKLRHELHKLYGAN